MIDTSVAGLIMVKDSDGTILAKVYYSIDCTDVRVSKSTAMEIAESIEEKLISSKINVRINESSTSCVSVMFDGKCIDFYWCPSSKGYGIRSKAEAIELAHFLKRNIDSIIHGSRCTPAPHYRIEGTCSGELQIYKDSVLYATARNEAIDKVVDVDEYYMESRDFDRYGLKAHCPKWDRIIRSDMMDKDLLKRICFFCMRYMDDNWR